MFGRVPMSGQSRTMDVQLNLVPALDRDLREPSSLLLLQEEFELFRECVVWLLLLVPMTLVLRAPA